MRRASAWASACHTGRAAEPGRDRAGAGGDRLAAGHARSRRGGRWPRAGRRASRWRPRPAPGPRPAQAKTRVSSPLRNRWQRTPPVARPLGGYSENGVTLTAPGSVPGSAVEEPGRGDHDRVGRVERAEPGTRTRRRLTRTPAMPPPDAALRPDLVGAEVEQLRVGGDEAEGLVAGGELDRADDLVAVLERDDLPLVPAEDLRVDPLDDALAGAEGEPGAVGGQRGERQRALAGLERAAPR